MEEKFHFKHTLFLSRIDLRELSLCRKELSRYILVVMAMQSYYVVVVCWGSYEL